MKITLVTPVKRADGDDITAVTLSIPNVGVLRGTKLTDVLQMDVNAMMTILPRVTIPALDPADLARLSPADFLSLAGALVGFFVTPEQRAQMEAQVH